MKQRLIYCFQVSVLSCAKEQWIQRFSLAPEQGDVDDVREYAAKVAATRLVPGERGIKVDYLGIADTNNGDGKPNGMGAFSVEIRRSEPLSDAEEMRRGEVLIRALNIQPDPDAKGRYLMEGGNKTPRGVFATVLDIVKGNWQ